MAAFDPSKYERLRIVGEGSFGKCWLVRSRGTGKELIQKVIDLSKMTAEERSDTQREVEVLGKLRHPYVIRYRESFAEKNQFLSLIMDYASGGDLYSRIRRQKREVRRPFPEKLVLRWFTQICLAVKYIHDQKILHRDLKTQNIFLSFLSPGSGGASAGPPAGAGAYGGSSHQQQLLAASNIKIGDFGIARTLSHTADVAKTAIGTPFYMSPEICQAKSYDYKSDIWACGCVLYEMSALKHAFDDESMKGLVLKILKGDFCREAVRRNYGGGRAPARVAQEQQEQKSAGAEDILELVEAALALDPRKRPMARDLLNRVVLRRQIFALLEEDKRRRNENNVPKAQDPLPERRPSLVVVEENESGRHGEGGAGEGGAGGAGKSVETSVKSKHVVQRNAAGNPAAGAKVEQQKRRHRSEPVDHVAPKPNIHPQHKNFPAPPAAGPAAGDEAAQTQKQKQNVVRIGSRYGKRVSTSPRGMVVADAMNQGIVAGGGAGARQPAAAAPTVAHGGPPPRRRSEPQRQRQLERQVAVSSRIDAVALRLRQEDKAKAAASDTCYTSQARIRKEDQELKGSDPVEAARAEYLRRKSDLARYKSEKELAMAADHARRVPEAKGDLHRGERPPAVEPNVSSYVRAQVAAGGGGGKSAHGRRTSAGDGSSERVAIAARGGENKETGGVEGDSAARVSRLLAKVDELSQQYAHRRKALQHAREREKAAEDKSRQQKQRRQGAVVDLVEMEQKEQSKPEEDGERRFVSAQMRALATPHADAHAGKQDEEVEKVPKKRPYRSFLYQHHSPGSTGLLAKLVLGEAECTADAEAETAPAADPAAGAGGETAPAHNAGDTQYVTAREGDLSERAAPVGIMTTPGTAADERTTGSGLEKTVALLLTSHEVGEGLEKTDLVERVKTPEMLAASTSSAGKVPSAKMKAVAAKEDDASAAKEEGARSKPAAQEQEALVELYSGPSKATASTATGTSGTTKTASPSAAQAAIARVLAKTHATDSVPYRLECVKAYLENEMGVGRLLFVYQLLAGRGGTTEGGTEEEKTLKITSKTMAFMPLVEQLRACENRFYEDQGVA